MGAVRVGKFLGPSLAVISLEWVKLGTSNMVRRLILPSTRVHYPRKNVLRSCDLSKFWEITRKFHFRKWSGTERVQSTRWHFAFAATLS